MIDNTKNSSSDKILYLLKSDGPKTASDLAKSLSITSMGARQHLQNLTDKGLIEFQDVRQSRGRPARYWMTTKAADRQFPDSHSDLTLQLIIAVEEVFGEQGVNDVIEARLKTSIKHYKQQLTGCTGLTEKLHRLVEIRSEEGYMASVEKTENGYILNENHCPICTAASRNKGLCKSELDLFRNVLGDQYRVDRVEHILKNTSRCSYQIRPH